MRRAGLALDAVAHRPQKSNAGYPAEKRACLVSAQAHRIRGPSRGRTHSLCWARWLAGDVGGVAVVDAVWGAVGGADIEGDRAHGGRALEHVIGRRSRIA